MGAGSSGGERAGASSGQRAAGGQRKAAQPKQQQAGSEQEEGQRPQAHARACTAQRAVGGARTAGGRGGRGSVARQARERTRAHATQARTGWGQRAQHTEGGRTLCHSCLPPKLQQSYFKFTY